MIFIFLIVAYILWLGCFRHFYFFIKYQKNKTGIDLMKKMEKK